MGSAVWCHMTMGKTALMHQQLCSPSHVAQQKWANGVLARLYCLPEEKKSQKVKCSPNPRKARKIGERGGEKSTVGTLSKKWLFGLFCREERKANRRNGKQKYLCKDRVVWEGKKSRGCCLQHGCVIPRHRFSAEQEQLRGEKCLVVLVGQKEGHMVRYGQKEKERKGGEKWEKYTVKKKKQLSLDMLIWARASISQVIRTGSLETRGQEEPKQRRKRWRTDSENRTNQEGPWWHGEDRGGGDGGGRMGPQQEWIWIVFILWTSVQHSYLVLAYHLGG